MKGQPAAKQVLRPLLQEVKIQADHQEQIQEGHLQHRQGLCGLAKEELENRPILFWTDYFLFVYLKHFKTFSLHFVIHSLNLMPHNFPFIIRILRTFLIL